MTISEARLRRLRMISGIVTVLGAVVTIGLEVVAGVPDEALSPSCSSRSPRSGSSCWGAVPTPDWAG